MNNTVRMPRIAGRAQLIMTVKANNFIFKSIDVQEGVKKNKIPHAVVTIRFVRKKSGSVNALSSP